MSIQEANFPKVHEGVTMTGYNPHTYSNMARTVAGVVLEYLGSWGQTGERREEPSGHSFPVYDYARTYEFHPYSGGKPVRCVAPIGYRTHNITRC